MMDEVHVIKIGGNIIDEDEKLRVFLHSFAALEGKKILVHGGGRLATRIADRLGVQQTMIEGRRITDGETLKIVTMVYAGYINKHIVATLQAGGCPAIGLTGADGNSIQAHKRTHPRLDFGFVGDIDVINIPLLQHLLELGYALVFAPITHNMQGMLLNTNADTLASEIAVSLSRTGNVNLIYSFEKNGVLMNPENEASVISTLTRKDIEKLKSEKLINEGMIPKLDTAFAAIEKGVRKVIIGNAADLADLLKGTKGTTIVNE